MTAAGGLCRALGTALVIVLGAAAHGQTPEFRAMWVSRYEWPDANPAITLARIEQIMADLQEAGFNAVFFQVRGQGDVLYPSPDETWSPLIDEADPGVDYLAAAIAAAHQHGLEFHAYINTHTCWQSDPPEDYTLPDDTSHLFYAHCNAADPEHRDWLHHTSTGMPAQFHESHYVWLAPGVPEMQAYVRRQVMHVVRNYDVDGVHFDRIRTPGTGSPSYDPISLQRFASSQSNPLGLDFSAWTADQMTRFVRDLYAAIMLEKPHVKVSASVFYNGLSSPIAQHQDSRTWVSAGALDMVVPMMYFSGASGSTWESWLVWWMINSAGRHVVAGHITTYGTGSLYAQALVSRFHQAAGNSVFSYNSFTGWDVYADQLYATPAATPAMPWKSAPQEAILCGTLRDWNGLPVVDAKITCAGVPHIALSGFDGFYSFLRLAPGTYTLNITHPAFGERSVPGITLAEGEVLARDIDILETLPPGDYTKDGVITLADLPGLTFCLKGPNRMVVPGHFCLAGDSDADRDIDLRDFAAFQRAGAAP